MNPWLVASLLLVVALLPCLGVCLWADESSGLAAVEVASVLVTAALLTLSQGLHRQPFVDLAVTFAFVSFVGSLAFARMMEREI